MNLSLVEHHIHNLRVAAIKQNLMFIPEQHTIWLTPEEYEELLLDDEYMMSMNPEARLKLIRSKKFLGVNLMVVLDHPSPLRA